MLEQGKIPYEAIDRWIEEHKEQLIEDVKLLSSIKSVSQAQPENKEEPYGAGCRQALDAALGLAKKYGFVVTDYDHYCGTAILPGETEEQIGFFGHMDVVPEGTDWNSDPYVPFVDGNYLVGRGTSDNKGPAMAAFYALRCIKELGLPHKHSGFMFFGCAEETGMDDILYYRSKTQPPKFSLIPDGFFSVWHGEKGILEGDLSCDLSGSNLKDFDGGVASNAVPARCSAVLEGVTLEQAKAAFPQEDMTIEAVENGVKLSTTGIAGHAAFPKGTLSAIWKLADRLAQSGLVTGNGQKAMTFLQHAFADAYGKGLGIDYEDEASGKTTHCGGMARVRDGRLVQNINVRYAVTQDQEQMLANLRRTCEEAGFAVDWLSNDGPAYVPKENPVIPLLNRICEEELHQHFEPIVIGGGSYARKLPNAVGCGACQHENSPYNGGHYPNEAMNITQLYEALRIYVRIFLELDAFLD